MKRLMFRELFIAMVGLTLLAGLAHAQRAGRRGAGNPRYDPATEVAVKGTVEQVKEATGRGAWTGTHLVVKTDKETLDVHLGPTDFLAKNQMPFSKGDQVEVTGSKVKYQGADCLLAREIKKGGRALTLRNAQGVPEWSRGRRRR